MSAGDKTIIGLLFVHGIGEQRRFEHLETEAREIVRCLKYQHPNALINVSTNTSQDSAYLAEQLHWSAEDKAPISIDIVTGSGLANYTIELRETWWADLDEKNTLWSQVKFWAWGLTQWLNESKVLSSNDLLVKMRGDKPTQKQRIFARIKLFFISIIFSMILVTLSFANFIVHTLLKGKIPGSYVISNYLGDVKLITQDGYEGKSTLSNLDLPPRVAIRRRIIRSYIDMAMSGYDRWYVLAHSLGTVVALNGLMETENCLPNYLTKDEWQKCRSFQVGTDELNNPLYLGGDKSGVNAAGKTMFPPRPPWLSDQAVIFREFLFSKLDGFLTYGSPLDKFSTLWPHIVGINEDEPAFNKQFQWVNVFDETDPVSGKLDYYGLAGKAPLNKLKTARFLPGPVNYVFSASPLLLYSHLCYLSFKPSKNNRLVNKLCMWIIEGGSFNTKDINNMNWTKSDPRNSRVMFKYSQWFVVAITLSIASGWVISSILGLTSVQMCNTICYWEVTFGSIPMYIYFGSGTAILVTLLLGFLKKIGINKLFNFIYDAIFNYL